MLKTIYSNTIWCIKVIVKIQSQIIMLKSLCTHHPILKSLHLLCPPLTPFCNSSSFSPLFPLCPGMDPMCAHILHLQHAILHAEWQRNPSSSITSHYLHKQSPAPFLWQSQLNLYGSFMYCLLTVPFCPPAIGLGPGYNKPGRMAADWRNAPQ